MKSAFAVVVAMLGIVSGCGEDTGAAVGSGAGSTEKVKKQIENAEEPKPAPASKPDSSKPGALSEAQPLMYSIADVTTLPSCTKQREGQVAYVRATRELMNCTAGEWEVAALATGAVTLPKIVTLVSEKDSDDDCLWGSHEHVSGYDLNGNGVLDLPQEGGSAAKVCKPSEVDNDSSGMVSDQWERRITSWFGTNTEIPNPVANPDFLILLGDVSVTNYWAGHLTISVSGAAFQRDSSNSDFYMMPFNHQLVQIDGTTKIHRLKALSGDSIFVELEVGLTPISTPVVGWSPSLRVRMKNSGLTGAWKDFSSSLVKVEQ
jgi:hypothetical protein